jgi:Zn-dependent peptidase ImmA (M78 family)/DNA-binding XRE family transcriptional regulator
MKESTKKVNPEMVEMAREARGLTQTALADRLGCTQATVSKIERDDLQVSPEMRKRLSEELEYPEDFFCQRGSIHPPGVQYRRSRTKLRARDRDRLDATHNIRARVIGKLLDSIDIEGENIPSLPIDEHDNPKEVARKLRRIWEVPSGPIQNLTKLVESNGAIVVHTQFKTGEMDGVYYPFPDLPPIIFLDEEQTGDRLRFTLAHELGHIVMHQNPADPGLVEEQTNDFVGEFMMPEKEIRSQLQSLDLHKLARKKREWKMSMGSILVHANRIGAISEKKYQKLWREMGRAGYRKREPAELEIPKEEPSLEERLIKVHLNELGYSVEQLSDAVHLNVDEFRDRVYDERDNSSRGTRKLHLNGH